INDMIAELFPKEDVKISTLGERVVLSGHVSNPDVANRLTNAAAQFVAQAQGSSSGSLDGNIVNMLTVAGEQQVMLRVKIVEASRGVLRELGISTRLNENEPGGIL